jgi:CRISPR-associated endonuclease/helicase Cas3
VLGWLWQLLHGGEPTPRRLVYCLPMRVLVEQSEREACGWIRNLGPEAKDVGIHVLMGGVESAEWYLHPDTPAILIGTQDLLLSRALNRGYAASRFHWPIDFGLLNNDCLWVFDEPQLMGSGVSTSAQLAGLRAALGTFGSCPSVWMSATLEPEWLDTVDFAGRSPTPALELSAADYDQQRPLHKRMTAEKKLEALGLSALADGKEVARRVVKHHIAGTQTLVVLNTVDRAKEVYTAIINDQAAPNDVLLVHSRFRPAERKTLNDRLTHPRSDRIVIATQVVEAGVDISARTLITELAPWASIVQRLGRCNRTGHDGPGQALWIDLDTKKQAAPYEPSVLEFAREQLRALNGKDASPKALDDFKRDRSITLPFTHSHVLRRKDLLDLFDTAPDLSGNDIDIQRFVRGDDKDTDVQVFWRDLTQEDWDAAPTRDELCNVPVGSIKAFMRKDTVQGFVWDYLDDQWRRISDPDRDLRPGLVILLPTEAGGYDWDSGKLTGKGWDEASKRVATPHLPGQTIKEEAIASDPNAAIPVALTIAEHTGHVCDELSQLSSRLGERIDPWRKLLADSARWHDAGKAHPVAQKALYGGEPPDPSRLLAKSGRKGRLAYERTHFRHELGSALAVLQNDTDWPFAVAYLIAAHHGRVRLSIRSLPGEEPPEPAVRLALGIQEGDELPEADLGARVTCPATAIDLSPMELGGEGSWTARALELLHELGPFRLAYLEALLRAADVNASRKEAENG